MRTTIDALIRNNRNPFICELSFLDTNDLVWLENRLSGGYWLGRVRRELNLRVPGEGKSFASRVTPHGYNVIFGSSY